MPCNRNHILHQCSMRYEIAGHEAPPRKFVVTKKNLHSTNKFSVLDGSSTTDHPKPDFSRSCAALSCDGVRWSFRLSPFFFRLSYVCSSFRLWTDVGIRKHCSVFGDIAKRHRTLQYKYSWMPSTTAARNYAVASSHARLLFSHALSSIGVCSRRCVWE
jgi:hypothetical protein